MSHALGSVPDFAILQSHALGSVPDFAILLSKGSNCFAEMSLFEWPTNSGIPVHTELGLTESTVGNGSALDIFPGSGPHRPVIDVILTGHSRIIDYGTKLVADLSDEQMILQPRANINHPAWILSHLNAYLPIMQNLMKGEPFPDPKDHPFGMQSSPQQDMSLYPGRSDLSRTFQEGNLAAAALLRELGEDALKQPVQLKRWQEGMPVSGMALGYIMLAHQGIHLGQISAWRRAAGFPPV